MNWNGENMRKIVGRYRNEIFLSIIALGVVALYVFIAGIFASDIDWIMQHSVFPDTFRKLFYKTGNFFPSFNANIGGGQNIYYMSYYGLYSPLYLLSYLLPFVTMESYIIVMSILSIVVGTVLVYKWLQWNGFEIWLSFALAIMYLLAAPIIYHSYTQMMFVNYMPFLLMSFIGVDIYFKKRKSLMLIISVFLMIMTSFYFSIGGIISITIYAIYKFLKSLQ